jgi:hypothetical protein
MMTSDWPVMVQGKNELLPLVGAMLTVVAGQDLPGEPDRFSGVDPVGVLLASPAAV